MKNNDICFDNKYIDSTISVEDMKNPTEKVGMFSLTKEQQKLFYPKKYVEDFKNKDDPIGTIIFSFYFKLFMAFSSFYILFFFAGSLTRDQVFNAMFFVWCCLYFISIIVVIYRIDKYHVGLLEKLQ